jgi:hypothetical protein
MSQSNPFDRTIRRDETLATIAQLLLERLDEMDMFEETFGALDAEPTDVNYETYTEAAAAIRVHLINLGAR